MIRLKLYAIARRILEPVLFQKVKDWEDKEDLAQWCDLKMYDEQSLSELLNSVPLDKLAKGTPFPVDMVQYFFKKGIRRNTQYWARVWTRYWLDKGYDVQEWVFCDKQIKLRWVGMCSMIHTDKGYAICQIRCHKWYKTIDDALADIGAFSGISSASAVKYKTYRSKN